MPPLNELGVKVISALAALRIKGQRAQLPFRDASIWASFGTSAELFVNAYPTGTDRGEFLVRDERRVEGVLVQRAGPADQRFECAGNRYHVRGAVPPGFADMDAFIAQFIRVIGCASGLMPRSFTSSSYARLMLRVELEEGAR